MKKLIIVFIIGIFFICFSGLIGSSIAWGMSVDNNTCYYINGDDTCINHPSIEELMQDSGYDKIVTKYYGNLSVVSSIINSLGIVISILAGSAMLDKKETHRKIKKQQKN